MLLKLLGWFWVITGIIFLFNPEYLRNRLKKKSIKKIRRIFFGIALILGLLLIKATWGVGGFLANIILICGIIAIIKAFFFLKAKAADSAIEWVLKQPRKYLRAWAVAQIIFGAIILTI